MSAPARFAAALSREPDATAAAAAAAHELGGVLGPAPSAVAVFATPDLMADVDGVLDGIAAHLSPGSLIGCTGEAVIARGSEIEEPPGLALWGANLSSPTTTLDLSARPHGDGVEIVGLPAGFDAVPHLIVLLADPFTFPVDAALTLVDERLPHTQVVGGLASGGRGPGEHRMLVDGQVRTDGAVALVLDANSAATVVSQGCRPVGQDMVITAADGPVIEELASRPALERLREVLDAAEGSERELLAGGLLVGLVIDENRPDYGLGDYLVRGVRGTDTDRGALLVGERVRVGQTMRFHVRDADSADADLRRALRQGAVDLGAHPAGALLFSCNGRGSRLFDVPDHDASAVVDELGDIPTVGLFCNGEIGPVGGRNFVHGFTATLALFPHDDGRRGVKEHQ
jgi:small ligand-binding sensory domain FIST